MKTAIIILYMFVFLLIGISIGAYLPKKNLDKVRATENTNNAVMVRCDEVNQRYL